MSSFTTPGQTAELTPDKGASADTTTTPNERAASEEQPLADERLAANLVAAEQKYNDWKVKFDAETVEVKKWEIARELSRALTQYAVLYEQAVTRGQKNTTVNAPETAAVAQ